MARGSAARDSTSWRLRRINGRASSARAQDVCSEAICQTSGMESLCPLSVIMPALCKWMLVKDNAETDKFGVQTAGGTCHPSAGPLDDRCRGHGADLPRGPQSAKILHGVNTPWCPRGPSD